MSHHHGKPKCSKTKKTVFMSLSDVEKFIQQDPTRAGLRPYLCDHCGLYHVSSMTMARINQYLKVKPLKYRREFLKYMKKKGEE